jgi:hypothetical protein
MDNLTAVQRRRGPQSQNLSRWSALASREHPPTIRGLIDSTGRKMALASIPNFPSKLPYVAHQVGNALSFSYRLGAVSPVLEGILITLRCAG